MCADWFRIMFLFNNIRLFALDFYEVIVDEAEGMHRNSCESLRELEKNVQVIALWLVFPQHFSFSKTFTHVCIA